jgi:hypothetical protein
MEIQNDDEFYDFLKEYISELSLIEPLEVRAPMVVDEIGSAFHNQFVKAIQRMPQYGDIDKDAFPNAPKPIKPTSSTQGSTYKGAPDGTEHTWSDGERYKKTGGKWVHVATGNSDHGNHDAIERHYEKANGIHSWNGGTYQNKGKGVEVMLSGKHKPYAGHEEALNHLEDVHNMARRVALTRPAGHSDQKETYAHFTHLLGRLGVHAHEDKGIRGALESLATRLSEMHSRGSKTGHYAYDVYQATHPGSSLGSSLRNAISSSVLNRKAKGLTV